MFMLVKYEDKVDRKCSKYLIHENEMCSGWQLIERTGETLWTYIC